MTNGSTWTKLDGALFVGPGTPIRWAWQILRANGRTGFRERARLIVLWRLRVVRSWWRRARWGR